jgi:PAS domain S-box-containing protein
MTDQDYKSFFDDAPLALLRTDIETGEFLMANKFAATLLGCSSVEELLKKNSLDFYSKAVRNRLIKKLKKNGIIQDQEIEMQVNGKHIWVKANIRINCGGTCLECFMSDITELVELRQQELLKMKCLSEKIDKKMAALAS